MSNQLSLPPAESTNIDLINIAAQAAWGIISSYTLAGAKPADRAEAFIDLFNQIYKGIEHPGQAKAPTK